MRHAFSLVELSIVLVILGLLTGGILAGQSLIRAAEIRSVSTEYGRYATAVNNFRDKYFALPGDMANASKFWGQSTACSGSVADGVCDGNGDGKFDANGAGANVPSDIFQFWRHLAKAGLIEGSYNGLTGTGGAYEANIGSNVPRSRVGNAGWTAYWLNDATVASPTMFEGSYGNSLFFGTALAGTQTWGGALKPEEAWNVDTKMDDGKPGLGLVRVREDQTACHDAGSSTSVALAASANYALTTQSAQCGFVLRMP